MAKQVFKIENFELKKVTVKSGIPTFSYSYKHQERENKETVYYGEVITELKVHEDLQDLMDSLKMYLAHDYSLKYDSEKVLQKMEVRSISFSGDIEDENVYGCNISGIIESPNGGNNALNSQRIVFGRNETGKEKEVEAICDSIITECFEMIFNGKNGNEDLFSQGTGDGIVQMNAS